MKKGVVSKIITVLSIVAFTIEVGVTIGYYMLLNIDFTQYDNNYTVEVFK